MKKVLITGKNSYVGEAVEEWLKQYEEYEIHTLDMRNEEWHQYDFGTYDTIFHVAGIAHSDVGQVSEEIKKKYYKVNTELAVETALKAKTEGVNQFILMSSMIIYGDSAPIGKRKVIGKNSKPCPSNFYGDSKLKADIAVRKLEDDSFKVVVLRPPMIYGKGSKGNYPLLSKVAKKIPIFPAIRNERSMLYIDNLCEFMHIIIQNEESGIFFPQNQEFTQTSEMVRLIAKTSGKKIWITPIFNWIVYILAHIPGKIGGTVNKVFGNLVYDTEMGNYQKNDYRKYNLANSIYFTEK